MNRMSVLPIEALVNETSLEVPVEIKWVNINSEKKYFKGPYLLPTQMRGKQIGYAL